MNKLLGAALLLVSATPIFAAEKLEYVVIMSRHGVRSSLSTAETLNAYSAQPWPAWEVPIGYLTKHGRTLMEFMGDYYREYLTKEKVLPSSGCAAAEKFYFWSDTDERDVTTGHALAERMFRNCPVTVHTVPGKQIDPIFSPVSAGLGGAAAANLTSAAVAERIAAPAREYTAAHRDAFLEMEKVLLGCDPAKNCTPEQIKGRRLLLDEPGGAGPLRTASSLADTFLLEYTDGLKPENVGWGRMDVAKLREFLEVRMAYIELALRQPFVARPMGSNMMSHILESMRQAAEGKPREGALGKAGDAGLVLLGHDSNETYLSGLLDVSWSVPGYPKNARPPGSAILFEMWKDAQSGKRTVHTWFVTQSLEQMHDTKPLSLKNPPARVALQLPGCEAACSWDKFQSLVDKDIDQAFVSNKPL